MKIQNYKYIQLIVLLLLFNFSLSLNNNKIYTNIKRKLTNIDSSKKLVHNNNDVENISKEQLITTNVNDIKTKNTGPVKYLIYIIYHDGLSKAIAEEFSLHHDWSKPLGVRMSVFFEAISFRDGISFNYEQWRDVDYVGLISYKGKYFNNI
jgi:hypothetical protein